MATTSLEGRTTCPFLLKLFYQNGEFHRLDEFASPELPPCIDVYTFPTCSLSELACHLASSTSSSTSPPPSSSPPSSPPPPVVAGTRLVFRRVYQDTHANAAVQGPARFVYKDLGSVVVGENDANPNQKSKTLADARFVVGDYIACAVLPPLANGDVASASSVLNGKASSSLSSFSSSTGMGPPPLPPSAPRNGWQQRRAASSTTTSIPGGEWHRGERVPEGPRGGGGGGGGRGGWNNNNNNRRGRGRW